MLKTDEPKRLFERKMQVDVLKTTSPKNNKVFILPKKKKFKVKQKMTD